MVIWMSIINQLRVRFMNSTIIGAGRLGKNIAYALHKAKIATIEQICNRSLDSAQQACLELGIGQAVASTAQLNSADIVWITCGDDAISEVVQSLNESSVLKAGCFVIHCSGVLNSSILAPLKNQGCFIASFHPLKAFKTGYIDKEAFRQVHCVMEGEPQVCQWLNDAFTQLEAQVITINPEAKSAYHAAAILSANYLITLAASSEELLFQSGLTKEQARTMICHLMQGNIDNLKQVEHISEALTGPLTRGDTQTLALHLQAIKNPIISNLYKAAGLATLPLTQLPQSKLESIIKMLEH